MWYYKQLCASLLLLVTLSACQTISTAEIIAQTQADLNRIEIGDATNRFEQIFKRQLADNLNQGPGLRDLTLSVKLTPSNSSTLAVKGKSSTLSKTTMRLQYSLTDRMSGEEITSGTLSSTATSGTVSSYYGQDKSKQFSAERLTLNLADKLTLTLRRHFLKKDITG